MNTQTETLKDLCMKNPALGNLLQFNVAGSMNVASFESTNVHFDLLYDPVAETYLVHYRCHNNRPAWEESPEGYVRCNNFDEVLEALNDEIREHHLSHGREGIFKHLWLCLRPSGIAPALRNSFSAALENARLKIPAYKAPARFMGHWDRWNSYLHRHALSA